MFTKREQLERKGGLDERYNYLSQLKDEFLATKSFDAKQQVLANLANFAYDPINFACIKRLRIVDVFLHQIQLPDNNQLTSAAVGGLCNLSNDPEISQYIISHGGIASLAAHLAHDDTELVSAVLTTLYYLGDALSTRHLITTPLIIRSVLRYNNSAADPRLRNVAAIFLRDLCDARQIDAEPPRRFWSRIATCNVGDKAMASKCITLDDVMRFAHLSGDTNRIHNNDAGVVIVHGALLNSIVSGVIESCYAGETVSIVVEVLEARKIIKLRFECVVDKALHGADGKCVLRGEANVCMQKKQ